jgi:hypothetical protein
MVTAAASPVRVCSVAMAQHGLGIVSLGAPVRETLRPGHPTVDPTHGAMVSAAGRFGRAQSGRLHADSSCDRVSAAWRRETRPLAPERCARCLPPRPRPACRLRRRLVARCRLVPRLWW